MALARDTGPEGAVVSYEVREDHHDRGVANVESFLGKIPAWVDLRLGDVREVAATGETFDRVILDLPEPWAVLPETRGALNPGGMLCTYLPTTNQVQENVLAMSRAGFDELSTFEVMLRPWHVAARSVRPDHRMVAHTGFITVGRRGMGRMGADR